MLTYQEITQILKMVDASDCEEFILELEGIKLVVRRGNNDGAQTIKKDQITSGSQPAQTSTTSPVLPAPSVESGGEASSDTTAKSNAFELRSPMVGTFFRKPAPDKPPFVEVGTSVETGTPLCLIEVMKLYTTIESTVTGKVEAIHADDGALVEYDQLLFVFSPTTG